MEGQDTSGKDPQTTQDVEMTPSECEEEKEEETFFVPLDVLLIIKTSQNQNGLRNNDYYRYYKYCSRKIHRLRKATKFTQGRRKFVKNEIDAEKVKLNQRAVQIPLFSSERDWSNAMFLKKQFTEHGDQFARNKHTARKKLKKAFQNAQLFFDIASDVFDKQTSIEAEAYLSFIKGTMLIEYSKYKEALDEFLKTLIIYKKLWSNKDSLEGAIYNEKIEQIEPLILLCTYNIQNQTGEDLSSLSKLESQYDQKENINNKVDNSITGKRKAATKDMASITYQGKSIPLKTQKLQQCFHKLESHLDKMEENANDATLSLEDKTKNQTDLLHIIEECTIVIQKEKTQETKKSEASGTLYNLLLGYVNKIKNTSILERCLLKAFSYAEYIPLGQVFTNQKLKAAQRPQIVMKLFDKALKALKTIAQEKGSLDPTKIAEYNQREMIIQVYLKFYIAVYYANEKRYQDCHTIIQRAKEEAERVISNATNSSENLEISKMKDFNQNQIRYMICKVQATLLLEQQKKVDSVGKDLLEMELDEKKSNNEDNTLNIVDWLFDAEGNLKTDSGSSSNYKVELTDPNINILDTGAKNALLVDEGEEDAMNTLLGKKVKLNKKAKIVDLFPKMQPVMPKPFFFDIAVDGVEYPNISETIKELEEKANQGTGLFGKIKGAFWG